MLLWRSLNEVQVDDFVNLIYLARLMGAGFEGIGVLEELEIEDDVALNLSSSDSTKNFIISFFPK